MPSSILATEHASGDESKHGGGNVSADTINNKRLEPIKNISKVMSMRPLQGYSANKDGLKVDFSVTFVNLDDERRYVGRSSHEFIMKGIYLVLVLGDR